MGFSPAVAGSTNSTPDVVTSTVAARPAAFFSGSTSFAVIVGRAAPPGVWASAFSIEPVITRKAVSVVLSAAIDAVEVFIVVLLRIDRIDSEQTLYLAAPAAS